MGKPLSVGVSFDGFAPYGEALAFAKEAAAAGAKSLWMADHLGYREPIVSCLGFASAIADVRVVPERFPVKSRLHKGWKGVAFNTMFVGTFNALPRGLVRRFGWHLLAFCRK